MKKKLLVILLTLALAVSVVFPALAVVDKSDEYYVADYAGVFSKSFKDQIVAINGDLEYYCDGAQLVVVTVNYLDGMYSDEYAMKLFNDWGVGSSSANNGMLLLLAVKENKAWLTVGSGISSTLTSSKIDNMFDDYFWDDFDNGNYQDATEAMMNALLQWYVGYYKLDSGDSNSAENLPDAYDDGYDSGGGMIFMGIFWIILIIVIFSIVSASNRRRYNAYYMSRGMVIPPYHWWFLFGNWWGGGPRPPRGGGPRPPRGGGGPRPPSGGGFGGFGGGGSGRGGSGFGGFGGGSSGGFGGFGGGGHSGGGFGGGGFGGGGGGRR